MHRVAQLSVAQSGSLQPHQETCARVTGRERMLCLGSSLLDTILTPKQCTETERTVGGTWVVLIPGKSGAKTWPPRCVLPSLVAMPTDKGNDRAGDMPEEEEASGKERPSSSSS